MGELAEVFAEMREMRLERRAEKEGDRVIYARKELAKLNYPTTWDDYNRCLIFKVGKNKGRIYPYTGWWSVKGIGSDRGVKKLLKELRRLNHEERA